jgi:23S rRNA (cytidine1920-2'-O)/16S rRNA (cytidine1409-2'-O)-methyltransferase
MSPPSKPEKAAKRRADQLMVDRGLAESRSRARAMLMAGVVFRGEQRIDKPGSLLPEDAPLRVVERSPYVSRGGEKLAQAVDEFSILGWLVADKICLDVGASTGGFSDCLLQHGARKVYAVDVGYGQLHPKLRDDPRVIVRERTNARHLTRDSFDEPIDCVVVDASFISLGKLAPAIAAVLQPGGELVALIKPQFEAGREAVAKGRGVIRDEALRTDAIDRARAALLHNGFEIIAGIDCRVIGPKGNREHLVYARRVVRLAQGQLV